MWLQNILLLKPTYLCVIYELISDVFLQMRTPKKYIQHKVLVEPNFEEQNRKIIVTKTSRYFHTSMHMVFDRYQMQCTEYKDNTCNKLLVNVLKYKYIQMYGDAEIQNGHK